MSWLLNSPSELTEKLYPGLKYSVMPQQGKTVLLKISNLKKKKKKKQQISSVTECAPREV